MYNVTAIHQVYDVPGEEELRAAYLQASKELDPTVERLNIEDEKAVMLEMWREQGRALGLDVDRLLQAKVMKLNRALNIDEEMETLTEAIKKMWCQRQPKHEQKVILEEELEKHFSKGWRFVNTLNNGSGKIIVEKA